jgi:hypothetical protein
LPHSLKTPTGRTCVGISVLHRLRTITIMQRGAISGLVALTGRHGTSANFQYEGSNAKVQSAWPEIRLFPEMTQGMEPINH